MIQPYNPIRAHEEIEEQLENAAIDVIQSGKYILGETVSSFEQMVKEYLFCYDAIGVASGSDALYLSLRSLKIGEGDEVITTPFTFFATAGAIMRVGAKPVFVDINPETYNIEPKMIEDVITTKTKAILPVHLFGLPADMNDIISIADNHNLNIVEDACQSFGAEIKIGEKWTKTGAIGTIGTFSFYPTKNLGGLGDGGMVTIHNNERLSERIRMLRVHGAKTKYNNEILGINSRLDAIQAAMLKVKLKYVDKWNDERRAIADKYNKKITNNKIIKPIEPEGYKHVYHQYTIRTKHRDELKEYLLENKIGGMIYYPYPLHLLPVFRGLGYKKGDFPESERASHEVLSLPMFPGLKDEEIEKVVEVINNF